MGIGNSGVEHAQFYRAKCFELAELPYKYVFTEFVKNLHEAMDAWNIPADKVINLWELLVFGEKYIFEGAKRKYKYKEDILVDETNTHRIKKTVTSSGLLVIEHLEKSPSKKQDNMLLVSDYQVEIYDYKTRKRKIMYEFYNHKHRGRLLKNIHVFDFEREHLFFRNEVLLQRFFFNYLIEKFEGTINFFIDRGQESEVALFNHHPQNVHLIEIIHADHLSDRDVASTPLWNNYYEYMLTHSEMVDRVVVATHLQKEDLLIDFPNDDKKITVIPVGGIRDFTKDTKSKKVDAPKKFISVSRLASEKHLDIVIKAMYEARKLYPEISLDIFGQGGEDTNLKTLIKELNAESYVKLKGHSHNINDVYLEYDAFISGSYSEGFGLTYIEALNAGLPIVTFKARFGAIELVRNGINGYLQDYSRTDDEYSVSQLKQGIEELMNSDFSEMVANTRSSVEEFQDSVISNRWRKLIDEL